jgi:shikimate kinase
MKIILAGFMGSGKSSVAGALARELGLELIEMDERILEHSIRDTINEIFEGDGEKEFRRLETAVCEEIGDRDNLVVSTGGGAVQKPENVAFLKKNQGHIVYLKTGFSTIVKRIGDSSDRPLFRDVQKAEELFETREPIYQQVSDLTVLTDSRTITEVVHEIIKEIKTLL